MNIWGFVFCGRSIEVCGAINLNIMDVVGGFVGWYFLWFGFIFFCKE